MDFELDTMGRVLEALEPLDDGARLRIVSWVSNRLRITEPPSAGTARQLREGLQRTEAHAGALVAQKALRPSAQSIAMPLLNSGQTEEARDGLAPRPAVPVTESVQFDYIVCLEDGKRLRTLKRYLRERYDMSPAEYRAKWGLKPDYPMSAPALSERRAKLAREGGFGVRKPHSKAMQRK